MRNSVIITHRNDIKSKDMKPFSTAEHRLFLFLNKYRSTDLQRVWGLDIKADLSPAGGRVHFWPPDLLIVAQLVFGENQKDVSPLLVSVVVEGQAAGDGRRGHGRGQFGYFLELLDVHGVHIHVLAWSRGRER